MSFRVFGLLIILLFSLLTFRVVQNNLGEISIKENISRSVPLIERLPVRVLTLEAVTPEDVVPVKCEGVPPITYSKVPSLESLDPAERKRKFIDLILPSILLANLEVQAIRRSLINILGKTERGMPLTVEEKLFVASTLKRCRSSSVEEVLIKAYPVPPSIVIAQSAIETGWGTSRFFTEGNNLFGMWTFRDDKSSLIAGKASVRLRVYPTILDSVRGYIYTLNVGWAYREFRLGRVKGYGPVHLSEFLSFYSMERSEYVRKIRRIIRENDLTRFDSCRIDPAYLN